MGKTIDQKLQDFSETRQKKIREQADRLIADYLTLQDLRKARKLTQVQLAKTLGKKQVTIAQMEKRGDLLLSTLRGYVEAMGGKLNLIVEFPDREPVILQGLASNDEPLSDRTPKHGSLAQSKQEP